jgi:peroxiredoxin Q/BCP
MKRFVRIALFLVSLVLLNHRQALAGELAPGDKAPDFSLPGTDGKTHSLSDYLGQKVVVLAWFPKAKTSGCTAECKSMREHGEAIRKFNVAYFAASCDTPELNKEFAEELGLDFPILSDPERKVSDAYGVTNEERKFPMRWTFYIGKDGTILAIDKQVKTASHGADVAARLKELGAPKKG